MSISLRSFVLSGFSVVVLVATGVAAPRAGDVAQGALRSALTFHASFDKTVDADFGNGDTHIYTATLYRAMGDAQPGLQNPDVVLAPGRGKFGGALEFKAKNTKAIYYQADKNVDYRGGDWSGTVSFWLSLDPEQDLSGFADPIQITDKDFNNAALWVDFDNDKPRHNRLGVFPDLAAWNPDKLGGQTNPAFLRHIVAVANPPYARGQWTHVAFTFRGLNGSQPGSAVFYLNGERRGTIAAIPESFSYDPAKATIRLGVNYAGLYDDLAVFNRALSEDEIRGIATSSTGIASLGR